MRKAVFILALSGLALRLLKFVINRESAVYTCIDYVFYANYIAMMICCILPWKKKKEL